MVLHLRRFIYSRLSQIILSLFLTGVAQFANGQTQGNQCQSLFSGISTFKIHYGELVSQQLQPGYDAYFLGGGYWGKVYRLISHKDSSTFIRKYFERIRVWNGDTNKVEESDTFGGITEDIRGYHLLRYVVAKLNSKVSTLWQVADIINADVTHGILEFKDTQGSILLNNQQYKFSDNVQLEFLRMQDAFNSLSIGEIEQVINADMATKLKIHSFKVLRREKNFTVTFKLVDTKEQFFIVLKDDNIVVDTFGHLVIIDPR
jgi:hypothetical protein